MNTPLLAMGHSPLAVRFRRNNGKRGRFDSCRGHLQARWPAPRTARRRLACQHDRLRPCISSTTSAARRAFNTKGSANMRTRDEHLSWCKRRALEYLDIGDLE